jgi:hypothetical protein
MAVKYIKKSRSKKRVSYRNTYQKRNRNRTRRNKHKKTMRGGWGLTNLPSNRKESSNLYMTGGGWGMALNKV